LHFRILSSRHKTYQCFYPCANPIENIFNVTKAHLTEQAVFQGIKTETFAQFERRVRMALRRAARLYADDTISSMPRRIGEVLQRAGGRSSY
jgi:hypothetical protein